MLFRQHVLNGIANGNVTLAFRRWRRAAPADGSTLRSPIGVLRLERVTAIEEGDITADDIARTGMTRDELRATLAAPGTLLRMEVTLVGDDPRIALRGSLPAGDELEAVVVKLSRLDVAAPAAWTRRYLQLIADHPGVVSHVLARRVDIDVVRFKRRIRQLKEQGLTESLEVGYRVSPRGRAVLTRLDGIDATA